MKLVAGLGNPGAKYQGTRHNVGFAVIDRLAQQHGATFDAAPADALEARWRVDGDVVLLVKPLTFMNLSGEAIGTLSRFYRIALADVLIVCDDVSLPLGRLRARASGSEGGHNGLRSVAQHLGTNEYARLRIGVGPSDPQRRVGDLADYVLGDFGKGEAAEVRALLPVLEEALRCWTAEGIEKVMNRYNRASTP